MKKIVKIQFFVLLVGTIFAWTNFSGELFAWLNNQACETGCSLTGEIINPFLSACFYGALFFTVAFIFNLFLLIGMRSKKEKVKEKVLEDKTTDSPLPTESEQL